MQLIITFLYELDTRNWPKSWQAKKSFDVYVQKFEQLAREFQAQQKTAVVFGDSLQVQEIARRNGLYYVHKPKTSWPVFKTQLDVEAALSQKRFRYNVPEFFSSEAICIWLAKLEALEYALQHFPQARQLVWLDAAITKLVWPINLSVDWRDDSLLHISLTRTMPCACNPLACLDNPELVPMAAGCFGARRETIQWLIASTRILHAELLADRKVGNEQQLFTILAFQHPERFKLRKSYKWGLWNTADWPSVVHLALRDSEEELRMNWIHAFILFAFLSMLVWCLPPSA